MQIFVKTISGEIITLTDAANTVDDVKQQIEETEGIPVEYQRLIFEGKDLEDGRDLSYYKVRDESTIHLTMNLEGGSLYTRHDLHLALRHLLYKKICRKCYCRLPPQATRCRKAKCGRTSDLRPKKTSYTSDYAFISHKYPF